jgi:hypothetical protein
MPRWAGGESLPALETLWLSATKTKPIKRQTSEKPNSRKTKGILKNNPILDILACASYGRRGCSSRFRVYGNRHLNAVGWKVVYNVIPAW